MDEKHIAIEVAKNTHGMCLAQAYATVKSSGYCLSVNKFDGVPHGAIVPEGTIVNVDVVQGIVVKSWVS